MYFPLFAGIFIQLGPWVTTADDCTKVDCRLSDVSLRFLAIGDFGGIATYPFYTSIQHQTAMAMGNLASELKTHFQLGLGDNFYSKGVKKVSDPRFKSTFEDVYTNPSLFTPWYMMAGNHDYNGNVSAQVEYTKMSQRWKFPALQYVINYVLASGTRVTFIVIDTIQLCRESKSRVKHSTAAQTQWRWLEEQLQTSSPKSDYIFLAGHYPVYSIAEHGSTPCLVDKLEPLMAKYRVSAYLSGHDHNLQHLSRNLSNWNLNYVVSGAGALLDGSTAHKSSAPPGVSLFFYPTALSPSELTAKRIGFGKDGGFLLGEVLPFLATFTFIKSDGTRLYQFQLHPRNI